MLKSEEGSRRCVKACDNALNGQRCPCNANLIDKVAIVADRMATKILTFEQDVDGRWYVVLPEWDGPREALEMVCGADDMLSLLAQGDSKVTLNLSLNYRTNAVRLILKELTPDCGGATYYAINSDESVFSVPEMWLCEVTEYVYDGEMPGAIFLTGQPIINYLQSQGINIS